MIMNLFMPQSCIEVLCQTLESVVSGLLSEETRLSILKNHRTSTNLDTNFVLTITSNSSKSGVTCNYCRQHGQVIPGYKKLKYKNSKSSGPQFKSQIPNHHSQTTRAVIDDLPPTFSLSDIELILKQLAGTSAASTSQS